MKALLALVLTLTASVAAAGPPPRALTTEEQKEVDRLRLVLERHLIAGQFEEAEKLARQVADYRAQRQGTRHWEVIDARLVVEGCQRWTRVPARDRAAVGRAMLARGEGLLLQRQRRYSEAEAKLREAVALFQKVLGEGHSDIAQCYNSLAFCLNGQGKYAEALPLFQTALDLRQKARGEQHPETATSYNNVAACLDSQGKYADALPLYQKALAINQKALGEEHPATARSYNSLASCLNAQGKYAEALPLFQKALDLRQKVLGEEYPDTATSYNNVAACLDSQGKYAEALPLFHKALNINRKALGEEHPDTATCYNSLAFCLNAQGKHAEALPLYQKALTLRRTVLGEEHPHTAASYNNVAACLEDQGRQAEALPLYQKALAVRQKALGEEHPATATSYNNVASCLNRQGKPAEALPLYRKALALRREVLGEQHPDTASSYNNVAFCLDDQGKYAEALPLFQKALAVRQKALGEQHPDTASSYHNLASCLDRQGQHAEAVRHWEKALLGQEFGRVQASATGFDRSLFQAGYASPQQALAVTLVRLKEPVRAWEHAESDLARGLLDDLLTASESAEESEKRARVEALNQTLLPLLTRETLNAEDTKRRNALAVERDRLLTDVARAAAKRTRDRLLPLKVIQTQIPADAAVILWLDALDHHLGCILRREGPPVWVPLPGSGKDDHWTDDDWSLTERTLAVLADGTSGSVARQRLLAALHRQRVAPLEPHLKGAQHLLVVPAGEMAKVPVEALTDRYTISYIPSASVYARRRQNHRPLEASSLLVLADPVFTRTAARPPAPPPHGLLVKAVTPGSLAARIGLRPGDVLLDYGDKKLTTPDDLKPAEGDQRLPIKLWRDGKSMAGRVPGGPLGVVVDKRPVALALADWRKQESNLLALSRGEKEWPPLPGTRLEAHSLAALVPKTTTLLGSDASVQRLDTLAASGKLKEFRLLHLATHGQADDARPQRTALVLAQDRLPATTDDEVQLILSGRPASDGKLTVGKVLKDWELDADLVVLSACQTGLGTYTSGEGMLGFTQALLQKQARSVVLSRWKVDDAATALLMARFYQNLLGQRPGLKEGMKRAEALQEAKVWLRGLPRAEAEKRLAKLVDGVPRGERGSIKAALPTRKPDAGEAQDRPFAHPYYWAAFILVGDPN